MGANGALDQAGLFSLKARIRYTSAVVQPTRTTLSSLALLVSAGVMLLMRRLGRVLLLLFLLEPLAACDERPVWYRCRVGGAAVEGNSLLLRAHSCSGGAVLLYVGAPHREPLDLLRSLPPATVTLTSRPGDKTWQLEGTLKTPDLLPGGSYQQLISLECPQHPSPFFEEVGPVAAFTVEVRLTGAARLVDSSQLSLLRVELRNLSTPRWLLLGRPDPRRDFLPCDGA